MKTHKKIRQTSSKIVANAQKAYKLLALQEGISNNEAKELIDRGLVSIQGKRLGIARSLLNPQVKFQIQKVLPTKILFEDENILALCKPAFLTSEEIVRRYSGWSLLHRLDRETSGVLLLIKRDSSFYFKAKEAFKQQQVFKEYIAIVEGVIEEECEIELPLIVQKGRFAKVIVAKGGLRAYSKVTPLEIENKKTKISIRITTGRTHQIRVHLAHIKHPILGDTFYGGKPFRRIMLHAYKIALLGYEFEDLPPQDFIFKSNL
ncbi:RluA family pseudouridine synthase [Helicobacter mesocricetorum]|uniref:RluA family pseudouridine synthase n=1 Tax=Helicobacter mesocricetorum TaxID=87012 RepID=UPI000CF1C28F|nr:RluA family pseudouridine synthase [Helicobacter mesocricetorum]